MIISLLVLCTCKVSVYLYGACISRAQPVMWLLEVKSTCLCACSWYSAIVFCSNAILIKVSPHAQVDVASSVLNVLLVHIHSSRTRQWYLVLGTQGSHQKGVEGCQTQHRNTTHDVWLQLQLCGRAQVAIKTLQLTQTWLKKHVFGLPGGRHKQPPK